jgi:hypothetical protein
VHPPSGARVAIPSGTLASDWILPYRDQLTAGQLRIVDRLLGVAPPGAGKLARVSADDYGDPTFKPNAVLQSDALLAVSEYVPHLGALNLTIVAGTTNQIPTTPDGEPAYAFATPLENANGDWGSGLPKLCRVALTPIGQADLPAQTGYLLQAIAHEVVHCYQFSILGPRAWHMPPAWITEGTAEWAGIAITPTVPSSVGGGKLVDYIASPSKALFTRTYDAVGFWGHVQDRLGDLWQRFPQILFAGSSGSASQNLAAFDAAGANQSDFLTTWGSSVSNFKSSNFSNVDGAWQVLSPYSVPLPNYPPFTKIDLGSESASSATVEAAAYATAQYLITAPASEPLLHVSIAGSARLSVQLNDTDLGDAWFCTTVGETCTCPADTTGTTPASIPLPGNGAIALGVTGDPGSGTHGTVSSHPLSEFCHPIAPPPGVGSIGCGGGDCAFLGWRSALVDVCRR